MSFSKIAVGLVALALSCSSAWGVEYINFDYGPITVPGDAPWVDTGLNLVEGDEVLVSAHGSCVGSSVYQGGWGQFFGPEGLPFCGGPGMPMPERAFGMLIGRIGQGAPFPISKFCFFRATESGQLYMQTNDGVLGDNGGTFQASIHILPGGTSFAENPGESGGSTVQFQNPMNSSGGVSFDISQSGTVELSLVEPSGRIVGSTRRERLPAGRHDISWHELGIDSRSLSSGAYMLRVSSPDGTTSKKLILVD